MLRSLRLGPDSAEGVGNPSVMPRMVSNGGSRTKAVHLTLLVPRPTPSQISECGLQRHVWSQSGQTVPTSRP